MTVKMVQFIMRWKLFLNFEIFNQDFMTSKATESGVVYCCTIFRMILNCVTDEFNDINSAPYSTN